MIVVFLVIISLTDMANAKEGESRAADIIKNWIRTRYTLEFLGTWEQINNPNFKVVEFDHFKTQAGLPSFVLSVSEWIEKTNATDLFFHPKIAEAVGNMGCVYTLVGQGILDQLSGPVKRDNLFSTVPIEKDNGPVPFG